jgi:hypothetical protein
MAAEQHPGHVRHVVRLELESSDHKGEPHPHPFSHYLPVTTPLLHQHHYPYTPRLHMPPSTPLSLPYSYHRHEFPQSQLDRCRLDR